jgi:hypothetical protein
MASLNPAISATLASALASQSASKAAFASTDISAYPAAVSASSFTESLKVFKSSAAYNSAASARSSLPEIGSAFASAAHVGVKVPNGAMVYATPDTVLS